jgi:hypothetical protein
MEHRDTDSTEGNTEKREEKREKNNGKKINVAKCQRGDFFLCVSLRILCFCVPSRILTYLNSYGILPFC